MPLYIIILSLSLLTLLIYVISYWRNYVSVKTHMHPAPIQQNDGTRQQLPGISVVIITHDSDNMLQYTIDSVAAQQYPDFEIVVVNNASTDNTNDVIKRAAKTHPNLLRSTHLPQNRNGILHMTIATTLGVRAARKEWIVLLRPNSTPKTQMWLHSIAQAIDKGYNLCIGYNQYYGIDDTKWERQAIRWQQKMQIRNFRAINRGKRRPVEACASNFAFRKQDFLDNGGYGRWLNLPNYHEHLYATTFAAKGRTAMLMHPDAQVETMLPPIRELWDTERQQTGKAYRKLSAATKMRRRHHTALSLLFLMATLTLVAGMALSLWPMPFDTSALLADHCIALPGLPAIPVLAPCAAIVFITIALIHLICVIHCKRQDRQPLSLPLVADPMQILNT